MAGAEWLFMTLALAGCLSSPELKGGAGRDGGGDADGGDRGPLVLSGVAARDSLILDGRDELVLAGKRREGTPVAIVLEPGSTGFAEVAVTAVTLPFDPVDAVVTRWGEDTGLFVAVGDGQVAAVDADHQVHEMSVTVDGVGLAFDRVDEIGSSSRRLILASGAVVYATELLGAGAPGDPLTAAAIATIDAAILGSTADGSNGAIGIIGGARAISVYPFDTASGAVEASLTPGEFAPTAFTRAVWRSFDGGVDMHLLAIDPRAPAIWWHHTPLEAGTNGFAHLLVGEYDQIHDLVATAVEAGGTDIAILVTRGGDLYVHLFVNPESSGQIMLGTPVEIRATGVDATGPVWLQAMDVVDDAAGENELVVYDQGGRAFCADYTGGELASCGEIDLGALLN